MGNDSNALVRSAGLEVRTLYKPADFDGGGSPATAEQQDKLIPVAVAVAEPRGKGRSPHGRELETPELHARARGHGGKRRSPAGHAEGDGWRNNEQQRASSGLRQAKCSPHPSEVRPPPNAKSTDSHARCSRAAPHEVRRAHTPRQEKEAVPCEPGRNVDSLHGRRSTAQRRVVDAGWLTPRSAAPEQSTAESSAAAHID